MRKAFIVFVLMAFVTQVLHAQFLSNPSFEGEGRDNNPPINWPACDGSPDNPPLVEEDIMVELEASDGARYLSMRARGDIGDPFWSDYRGIRDKVSTRLLRPLIQGVRYELSIDLATDYEVVLFSIITEMDHAQLRIWGGNGPCNQAELLASSGAVENTDWETFKICFEPKNSTYTYFFLEADYIDNDTLNGIILADNLSILQTNQSDTLTREVDADIGETVVLDASLSDGYSWSPPDGLSCTDCQSPILTVGETNTYYVDLQRTLGCFEHEMFIILPPSCEETISSLAGFQLDTVINYGESVDLFAPFGETFVWEPTSTLSCENCKSTIATPELSSVYTCLATDAFGCQVNLEYNVEVRLNVPNAITPNYDGVNDSFFIEGLPENSRLKILDRSGNLIFQSSNYGNNWPQVAMNKIITQTDTYWYLLECPEYAPMQGYVLVKF